MGSCFLDLFLLLFNLSLQETLCVTRDVSNLKGFTTMPKSDFYRRHNVEFWGVTVKLMAVLLRIIVGCLLAGGAVSYWLDATLSTNLLATTSAQIVKHAFLSTSPMADTSVVKMVLCIRLQSEKTSSHFDFPIITKPPRVAASRSHSRWCTAFNFAVLC